MLSKKALEDFKQIWRKQFGEDISDKKATEEGINLLTLMSAIYRPVKKSWLKEIDDTFDSSGKDKKQPYPKSRGYQ